MSDALRQALTRSLAEDGLAPRAVPLKTVDFAAFKVSEAGRTYVLGDLDASTLDGARDEAVTLFALHHKERLVIRERGENGARVHVYAVRQKSAPRYVFKDHIQTRTMVLYAELVCSIDGGVLEL